MIPSLSVRIDGLSFLSYIIAHICGDCKRKCRGEPHLPPTLVGEGSPLPFVGKGDRAGGETPPLQGWCVPLTGTGVQWLPLRVCEVEPVGRA